MLNDTCRNTDYDSTVGYVFYHRCAGTNGAPFPDSHTWNDRGPYPDERSITHLYLPAK